MHSSPDRMGSILSADIGVAAFEEAVAREDSVASARLEGFRQGREEGHAIGLIEGRRDVELSMAGLIDGLKTAALQVESVQVANQQQVCELAAALAVELAEALVGGDLSLLETGQDVVARALATRRSGEVVKIHVHPSHPALADPQPRPGVELIADAELATDAAYAEVGEGIADLSMASAIQRVREELA